MTRMVSGDCVKSVRVDMEYGHLMFFERWTFICDGMWQSNANFVFVALVMTTVVISVFVAEYVIFRDVGKNIANCYIVWATGLLKSKPTAIQGTCKLINNKQSVVGIINNCHHQPRRGSIRRGILQHKQQ